MILLCCSVLSYCHVVLFTFAFAFISVLVLCLHLSCHLAVALMCAPIPCLALCLCINNCFFASLCLIIHFHISRSLVFLFPGLSVISLCLFVDFWSWIILSLCTCILPPLTTHYSMYHGNILMHFCFGEIYNCNKYILYNCNFVKIHALLSKCLIT